MSIGIIEVWNAEGAGAISSQPQVAGASAVTDTTVRVTFDQPVKHTSPGSPDDALNPTNYAFTGGLSVSSVALVQVFPTIVDVTVNEMHQGDAYQVQVSNVENLINLVIDPLYDTAGFTGVGTAPKVLAAAAQDEDTVRVTFDEPMKNNAALTTPSNYSLTGGLIASAVLRINSENVEVTVNEMKDADIYTVTVSNVSDLGDNVIAAPPDNQADFNGIGVAPQLLPTVNHVLGDDQSIYIDYDETVQVSPAEDAANYDIVPSLGLLVVVQVTATRYKVTFTDAIFPGTTYTITADNILDIAGNIIDPAHKSASWLGVVSTPPLLYFYPGDLVSNVAPRDPLRVQAVDREPAPSGIDLSSWDISIEITIPDGSVFSSDVLSGGVGKEGYGVAFLGDASDASDGIYARFLPKSGFWPEDSTIKVFSLVNDNEGNVTSQQWTCYTGEFVCFENRIAILTTLDQAIISGYATRFPNTDRLRQLLMRACTTSTKTYVQARTLTWLAFATDLKTILARVTDLGQVENLTLCERNGVLSVYNMLLRNHTITTAAKNEMTALVKQRTLDPFLRYTTSASPLHVVGAFCALVVLAATASA